MTENIDMSKKKGVRIKRHRVDGCTRVHNASANLIPFHRCFLTYSIRLKAIDYNNEKRRESENELEFGKSA